jgi:hypothetical protein|tara:strand:+ start:116 stop:316 length:201 start_codon:yes stop_codon:yes gene_type:complete
MPEYIIIAHSEDLQLWHTKHPEGLLVAGFEFRDTICRLESDNPFAAKNAEIVLRKAGIRVSIEAGN